MDREKGGRRGLRENGEGRQKEKGRGRKGVWQERGKGRNKGGKQMEEKKNENSLNHSFVTATTAL